MAVFLNLFTKKTWDEFKQNGSSVSGFPKTRLGWAKKVKVGDYLVCYIGDEGFSRLVGMLEVASECYEDHTTIIWRKEIYPIRFKVKILVELKEEQYIPIKSILDELECYQTLKNKNRWSIIVRGSLLCFSEKDAIFLIKTLTGASSGKRTPATPSAPRKQLIKNQILSLNELKDVISGETFKKIQEQLAREYIS